MAKYAPIPMVAVAAVKIPFNQDELREEKSLV